MEMGKAMGDYVKKREPLFDVLRGFAIILVVFAHCIQNGSGAAFREDALYFGDRLYQFIYSFHMPLFMMVSGYLCYESMQRAEGRNRRRSLLKARAEALLLPIFLWTALDYARILLMNHINGIPQPEAVIFVYFYNALNNLWFLWAVWWSFLIVYVMHYFFHDNVFLYVLGFLALFVIPDGLGLGAYKYMLPYFIAAFYGHNIFERCTKVFSIRTRIFVTLLLGICFALLFYFFSEESFIYLTGYKLIGRGGLSNVVRQLAIDIYRTAVGFAGGLFFAVLWQGVLQVKTISFLSMLGRNSLGIYILSGYLIVFGVQRLEFIKGQSYALNLLEALAVVLGALVLSELMGKIPLLKRLVGK